MVIKGVKNVKTSNVKSISVELDSEFTDGHTFCEMHIDEENGRFTAILYGGESYTFKNNHENFVEFLIRELRSEGNWLYRQMRDARLDDIIDADTTTETMVEHIKESFSYKEDPTYYNSIEDMGQDINNILHDNGPLHSHSIWDVWDEWFEPFINDNLLPNAREIHDEGICLIKEEGDYKCRIFCEKVAPILAEVLKEEYKLAI